MKSAFLWLISPLIKLWRTVKKYVCRNHIVVTDVTGDGVDDLVVTADKEFKDHKSEDVKKEEN